MYNKFIISNVRNCRTPCGNAMLIMSLYSTSVFKNKFVHVAGDKNGFRILAGTPLLKPHIPRSRWKNKNAVMDVGIIRVET